MDSIRAGVATISDKGAAGEREDISGPLLADLLREMGAQIEQQVIIPDERGQIEQLLIEWSDERSLDLIVTTGGTGATPRDVTPEATKAVIEREMPGIVEVLRFTGYQNTPLAVLSRGVAGLRGHTLIVNLPGSPGAVRDGMETLTPILPHAVRMARGEDTGHDHEEEHHNA